MYMLGGKNEKYPVYSSIFLDASSILEASTGNKYWVKIQKDFILRRNQSEMLLRDYHILIVLTPKVTKQLAPKSPKLFTFI